MARPSARSAQDRRIALMFDETEDDLAAVLRIARRLRAEGLAVSVEARGKRMGARLAALEAHGFAGFAVFDGTDRPELRWFGHRDGPAPGGGSP
jgi:hypothetical protein